MGNVIEFNDPHDEQWHANRRKGFGGSDAPIVWGISPWKSRLQLYAEKIGAEAPNPPSERQLWGLLLEDLIGEEYARRTGRRVEKAPDQKVHPEYPFMRAHLDFIMYDDNKPGPGVLQIKTAEVFKRGDWQDANPLYYQVQLQHEMEVAQCKWGGFGVLLGCSELLTPFGGAVELPHLDVDPNPEFVEALIAKEKELWEMIQNRTPPELSSGDGDAIALASLFPEEKTNEGVELPDEFILIDEELEECKKQCREWFERKKQAENRLKQAIGEHPVGWIRNGANYTWKLQHRQARETRASSFRVLRRHFKKSTAEAMAKNPHLAEGWGKKEG